MKKIKVVSTKYDHSPHRSFEALLLEEGEWGWLIFHDRDLPMESYRGNGLSHYRTLHWYFRNEWWNVSLFFNHDGSWRTWYCNIITPAQFENGTLYFHDLDLDVVWHQGRGIYLDDIEEFEQHSNEMAYPPHIIEAAWKSAQHVQDLITTGGWRFAEDPQTIELKKELAPWNVLLT